ncbi:DinB family protein [Lacinutrix venerupis]|uniref:DinB superfamily protein n=1 Tax=Lacinutrix venerupis TaxID=1486034 RepID=A0AAC9PX45_9FLAO|nr:DinB family protein [Lacinutrix venerupis]APY00159.1 DinB superfamily protein [Lacinutrix venerupis]
MLTDSLIKLYKRELNKLKDEINLYKNETNLWLTTEMTPNCAGNLCLHIVGNLNHFIGAELGNTGYVRQRELEFSLKDVSKKDLCFKIDEVVLVIENTLKQLTEDDLNKEYKRRVFEDTMTVEFFVIHLLAHLTYHLGQINYHRRLLE